MGSDAPLSREYPLAAGVTAVVSDASSHYFGGYYHVRLVVVADVPLAPDCFPDAAEYEEALRMLGPTARFSRTMEKMAVPQAEVETVRCELLQAFESNLLAYLSRPDFPARFVQGEYAKSRTSPRHRGYGTV